MTAIACISVIVLFNLEKLNLKLSKNQVNFVDVLLYVDYVCVVVLAKLVVADKYVGVEMFIDIFTHTLIEHRIIFLSQFVIFKIK